MTLESLTRVQSVWFHAHTLRGILMTSVVAGSLSMAPFAAAQDRGLVKDAREDGVPRFHLGGRAGVGGVLDHMGYLASFEGGYRVIPSLIVGASVELPIAMTAIDGDGCGDAGVTCASKYVLAGARAEFQPWASAVVGPWTGLELGGFAPIGDNVKGLLPAMGWDIGVDVRPVRALSVGAYFSTTFLFANPYVSDYGNYYGGSGFHLEGGSLGLRVTGRFDLG